MYETELITTVIDTVPQWYYGSSGPHQFRLSANTTSIDFFGHRNLTPELARLRNFAQSKLDQWLKAQPGPDMPGFFEIVQDRLAIHWLEGKRRSTEWRKVFRFLRQLQHNTIENNEIAANIVIGDGIGASDLSLAVGEKLFGQIGSSAQSYIRVDDELQFIDYSEIPWQMINETTDYKFNPEFIQPTVSVLNPGDISLHLTKRRDIVLADRTGLVAAKRRGHWYFYDVSTMKNSIRAVFGKYRIGCNLFEVMFDLSYKRHGALLIYDPHHRVISNLANPQCRIGNRRGNSLRENLGYSVREISMAEATFNSRRKRLLLELASIDGAVIFDNTNILAYGALVNSHNQVSRSVGARTNAALSALYWGGIPLKISSDGDISIYFENTSGALTEICQLDFM